MGRHRGAALKSRHVMSSQVKPPPGGASFGGGEQQRRHKPTIEPSAAMSITRLVLRLAAAA
jgi:hypothetical protein